MIEVSHLTKRFGRTPAISDISFRVEAGEIVGFLGPNGAGKTTTMRILSCYLPPTGGRITVAGLDVFTHSLAVRDKIGYLPENVPLYEDMRVTEYLTFRARLKGMGGARLRRRLDESMAACSIEGVRGQVIRRLSKGYRQRVGLADVLLNEPELLILDEPTLGLDPNQIREIRALIRSLARRHTVLLSSHILPEVEMICDRVLIMNRGKIVASDTTEHLVGLMKGNSKVILEVRGPLDPIREGLQSIPGVVKVICEDSGEWHRLRCECESDIDVCPAFFALAAERQWPVRELRQEKPNLEDVFAKLTG